MASRSADAPPRRPRATIAAGIGAQGARILLRQVHAPRAEADLSFTSRGLRQLASLRHSCNYLPIGADSRNCRSLLARLAGMYQTGRRPERPDDSAIATAGSDTTISQRGLKCWMMVLPRTSSADAEQHTDGTAETRQQHGLDDELAVDVGWAGARALRMPISRMRSDTDTSMMFMMPTPPTKVRCRPKPHDDLHDQTDAISAGQPLFPRSRRWRSRRRRGGVGQNGVSRCAWTISLCCGLSVSRNRRGRHDDSGVIGQRLDGHDQNGVPFPAKADAPAVESLARRPTICSAAGHQHAAP